VIESTRSYREAHSGGDFAGVIIVAIIFPRQRPRLSRVADDFRNHVPDCSPQRDRSPLVACHGHPGWSGNRCNFGIAMMHDGKSHRNVAFSRVRNAERFLRDVDIDLATRFRRRDESVNAKSADILFDLHRYSC